MSASMSARIPPDNPHGPVTGGYALPRRFTIAKATIPVDIPDMWEGRCGSGFDRMDLPAEGICSALRRPKRFQRKRAHGSVV